MRFFKENIIYSSNILVVKEENFAYLDFPLHYHPEYEIILILKGNGKRYVGDNVSDFEAGDLCFFGPNLLHTYGNKGLTTGREVHQIVIQFNEHFLGKGVFDKVQFKRIKSFLIHSTQGYHFHGATLKAVSRQIKMLLKMDEADVIIHFLLILNLLSRSTEFSTLASVNFDNNFAGEGSERLSRVLEYIQKNYRQEISLSDISSVACLSPGAFCRYFKKYTRKTFSAYVVELRIGYACRLLQENKLTISQVCIQTGFNNITYFNRKFKEINQTTPHEYQKQFSFMRGT